VFQAGLGNAGSPALELMKTVAGLRDIAHLYQGFLFDASSLIGNGVGSSTGPYAAAALRCARELLGRGKQVAVVHGTASRASALAAAAQQGGLPEGVRTWSSGEFICQSLAAGAKARTSGVTCEQALALLPFLGQGRAPRVFELSALARPRRWAEAMARGSPPLASLEQAGAVQRVADIEKADVCYWDVHEGDEVSWLEATLELCAELKVPLLQGRRGAQALRLLAASSASGGRRSP